VMSGELRLRVQLYLEWKRLRLIDGACPCIQKLSWYTTWSHHFATACAVHPARVYGEEPNWQRRHLNFTRQQGSTTWSSSQTVNAACFPSDQLCDYHVLELMCLPTFLPSHQHQLVLPKRPLISSARANHATRWLSTISG
jgi:hypothetical protein